MQEQQTKKNKKVLSITFNVIFYLIIAFLLIFSIMTIRSSKVNSIPNIFGKGYVAVQTDSMDAEMPSWVPSGKAKPFKPNTLLFINVLNDDTRQNIEVGDVITFFDYNLEALNTHRVKEVIKSGDTITKLITQGDKYQLDDGKTEEVLINHVYALHKGARINGLGWIFIQLQKKWVFLVFIIIPVFIVLVVQAFFTFNALFKAKLSKEKAQEEDLIEQRVQAEIERRLKEEKNKK